MANVIKIKKGLNIPLVGEADNVIINAAKSTRYALIPDDFHGVVPKILVKSGEKVKVGTPLMCDKNRPEVCFVSPVSGEVTEVVRGERRKVMEITLKSDDKFDAVDFGKHEISEMTVAEIKEMLLRSGLFPYIKQRPYDIIANPEDTPRDIFVTAIDSAPLAPAFSLILKREEESLKTGLAVLARLTSGKVYLGIDNNDAVSVSVPGCETVRF